MSSYPASDPRLNGQGVIDAKDLESGTIHRDNRDNINGYGAVPIGSGDGAMLQRMATAGTLPPDLFERLYLQPQISPRYSYLCNTVAGDLRKRFGNPTPIALLGFSVGLMPLSIALMGWRGSGGNAVATTGATLWFGGMLLILAGIGEWILGNNFPFIVFMGYGSHFLAFGVIFIPYYNAIDAYLASNGGAGIDQFYASYGFYPVAMAILSFIYLIGSLRTNIVFVLIFVAATIGFSFAAAGFFALALGNAAFGSTMIIATGGCFFAADLFGWYLLLAAIIEIQEIPIPSLPLVDLSTKIKAKSLVRRYKDSKES